MGDFTRVKSPMKIHGRFYLSKKTPDYKMTHQLFTLFWIISNILTFHFNTFSVIYTFYFYIAFEELTFYQKCSIKCILYSLFYNPDGAYKLDIPILQNLPKSTYIPRTLSFFCILLFKDLSTTISLGALAFLLLVLIEFVITCRTGRDLKGAT